MNGNKVFLTDKKTGDKACVEMLNSATIKVSYNNGKEETFDTKGNLISYNYGAQAPSMKSINKKKNKFFSKEGFILGMIIALSILCIAMLFMFPNTKDKNTITQNEAYSIMRNEINPAPAMEDIIFSKTDNGYQLNTQDGSLAVLVYYDSQDGDWKVHNFH